MPTPDMEAAGVAQPESDPASILRALSMGQPVQQSPVNTWAATLGGFGAGMQGKENPVIAQQMQQQDVDRRSQMAMFSVLQGMQAQKQRKQSALREILSALPDDNPEMYTYKVKGLMRLAEQNGAPAPPELGQALLNRTLKPEQVKEAVRLLSSGVMPGDIQRLIPGASLEIVERLKPLAQNDRFLASWGLPTNEGMRKERVEAELKDFDLLEKRYGLDPKHPQTQWILQQSLVQHGKPFSELGNAEQREMVKAGQVMATGKLSNIAKQAVEEFGSEVGVTNTEVVTPEQRERAINLYRAKRQKEMLQRGAEQGQLTVMGRVYQGEANRIEQNRSRVRLLDDLANRMDRLIDEGQALGMTNNPKAVNAVKQELKFWTAGSKLSPAAQWYRAWDTMDAQFATVAQAIEQVTGNRLAQSAMERALGYHPKRTDPYQIQKRILTELKKARDDSKRALDEDQARVLNQFGSAAGTLGVPFILGQQGQRGWDAEPE